MDVVYFGGLPLARSEENTLLPIRLSKMAERDELTSSIYFVSGQGKSKNFSFASLRRHLQHCAEPVVSFSSLSTMALVS